LKQYLEMKDSRIEWIGKIPEKWFVKRLKYTTKFQLSTVDRHEKDDEIKVSICHYPHVYKNEKITSTTELSSGTCSTKELKKFRLKKNDVLITKDSETPDEIGVPSFVEKDFENTVCGYHLAQLTSDKTQLSGEFLFRFMQSDFVNAFFETESNGITRYGLGKDSIGNLRILLPSILLQKAISDFLEKKTIKIDNEISNNQKLIELLKEKRQATINQAVTKGLDPNVIMKDSGIESIGKIPKHWLVFELRYLLIPGKSGIKIGPFGSSVKLDEMVESGFKVYGQENVIYDNFSIGDRFIAESKFYKMIGYEIGPGDIVVTMMGTTGFAKVVPKKIKRGIMDSHLVRIRTNEKKCNNYFLTLLINSSEYVKYQLKQNSKGAIMEGLNSSILKSIKIFLPESLTEQEEIFDYFNKHTLSMDSLISKVESQIQKLKKFRKSLISSAVTGKIKVPGA